MKITKQMAVDIASFRDMVKNTKLDKADIPNFHGFEFIGIDADGNEAPCYVSKDENGVHHAFGMPYKKMKFWRKK